MRPSGGGMCARTTHASTKACSFGCHNSLWQVTDVITVDPVRPEAAAIQRAADCLRDGGLVAFPTETVYGLGVHALDRDAVRRLFAAKGRPANDPVIVHIASLNDIGGLTADLP